MISMVLAICVLALAAGTLLLRSVPLCSVGQSVSAIRVSLIVPARNEERNLPRLLQSLENCEVAAFEVIVVDDGSTDATAVVAASAGAKVLTSLPLPSGWTGKTWACAQGVQQAQGDVFLFLDADTWFAPKALGRLVLCWERYAGQRVAMSVLPFHILRKPYEELSLFFNLLMAFGAGGFGVGAPKLFGQCLLISRDLYEGCGGHAAVRDQILENLAMADRIQAAGGACICFGGRGVLHLRMFPEGFKQLSESWKKAFSDGAAATDNAVFHLTVVWLAALSAIFLLLCIAPSPLRIFAAIAYLVAAIQTFWLARQIGHFRWVTALFYPIPLLFFFGLFTRSLMSRKLRRQVTWRGRQV
jgi:4,4'-diaponeurosporenoate glycosyltransferase